MSRVSKGCPGRVQGIPGEYRLSRVTRVVPGVEFKATLEAASLSPVMIGVRLYAQHLLRSLTFNLRLGCLVSAPCIGLTLKLGWVRLS